MPAVKIHGSTDAGQTSSDERGGIGAALESARTQRERCLGEETQNSSPTTFEVRAVFDITGKFRHPGCNARPTSVTITVTSPSEDGAFSATAPEWEHPELQKRYREPGGFDGGSLPLIQTPDSWSL